MLSYSHLPPSSFTVRVYLQLYLPLLLRKVERNQALSLVRTSGLCLLPTEVFTAKKYFIKHFHGV